MTFDFTSLAQPDPHAEYEFYGEVFLPVLLMVVEQARAHVRIAEREGGKRLEWCRAFHQAAVDQYEHVLLATTDLGTRLGLNPHEPPEPPEMVA
jgi:hypothetical protein